MLNWIAGQTDETSIFVRWVSSGSPVFSDVRPAWVRQFGRFLAPVRLQDGRDLGQALLKEDLARPYEPGHRPNWCG
jgi:endonuclease YncB( thermonuclease family)